MGIVFHIIIAILVLLVLYLIIVFLKISNSKQSEETRYEISLKELSPIWLKYNREFQKKDEELEVEVLVERQDTTKQPEQKVPIGIDTTAEFYNDVIKPYEAKFKEQNVYEVLVNTLKMLDKHGHVPSVVIDVKDNESVDLISVRDNLAQVTLREHTMAVVRGIIDCVKQTYSEYENFIPQAVIVALAHDIGKIPELRLSGAYNSYDHAIVSSNWLAEQFVGKDVFWAKQAVQAVRDHHLKSKEPLTQLLRDADKQARQMELVRFTQNYSIQSFNEWFVVDEFLKYLEQKINVTAQGKWDVFSFKGIVYVKLDLLYETVKKLAFDKKVLDVNLLYESEKENVTRKIVEKLREQSLVPDIIASNYIARKFEIKMKMQVRKQQMFLTAIKIEPFIDKIDEIESRKAGTTLELIEAVIPV